METNFFFKIFLISAVDPFLFLENKTGLFQGEKMSYMDASKSMYSLPLTVWLIRGETNMIVFLFYQKRIFFSNFRFFEICVYLNAQILKDFLYRSQKFSFIFHKLILFTNTSRKIKITNPRVLIFVHGIGFVCIIQIERSQYL